MPRERRSIPLAIVFGNELFLGDSTRSAQTRMGTLRCARRSELSAAAPRLAPCPVPARTPRQTPTGAGDDSTRSAGADLSRAGADRQPIRAGGGDRAAADRAARRVG